MTTAEQSPSSYPSIEQEQTPDFNLQVRLGTEAIVKFRQFYHQETNEQVEV